jgi:hypothetical protein
MKSLSNRLNQIEDRLSGLKDKDKVYILETLYKEKVNIGMNMNETYKTSGTLLKDQM